MVVFFDRIYGMNKIGRSLGVRSRHATVLLLLSDACISFAISVSSVVNLFRISTNFPDGVGNIPRP